MSEIAPPLPRTEPSEDLEGRLVISPRVIIGGVWHLFISMRFGLVLILFLAVLGLVGTLLMQAPAGLKSDPQQYDAWLQTLRPKYGGWTGVFEALGFFAIFSSIWFQGTAILLMASTLACSVNRGPILWRQARHPRMDQSEAFFARAPLRASIDTPLDTDAAVDVLRQSFRAKGYRTVVERDERGIHVLGDRFRWGPFGTVIAHLSLVVVVAGVLIGSAFGFRDSGFAVPIGTRVDVGYGSGLTVVARSFTDTYNSENGAPSDYESDLVVYRGQDQVAAQTIRVNQPLTVGDVSFYQSFFGPAAQMRIADASGAVIYTGGVPLLWNTKDETERAGRFDLPSEGLTAFVVSAASGKVSTTIKPGQVQVELYKSGTSTPVGIAILNQGKPAVVGGLTATFEREQQFTGLIVAKDPGVPLVWGGSALLVIGMCIVFFLRNRRTWALVRPREGGGSTVRIGAVVRHDAVFESEFQQYITALTRALAGRTDARG
jgi:cytochrome c biogenesis protein